MDACPPRRRVHRGRQDVSWAAYHRHPVLVAFREKLRNPRECAEAAEEAPDPGEVSSDLDPGLEAPGLDEVGGDETCRDPGGVAHGGDQVQLLARHVIIRRSLGGKVMSKIFHVILSLYLLFNEISLYLDIMKILSVLCFMLHCHLLF